MKKLFRFDIFIFGIILLSHIYISISPIKGLMNWFRTDDAFYYFQTARNISNGLGVTFDGINLSNGFHPLWMIVCVPIFSLARFDIYLPFRVLILILGILHATSSVLIYHWLTKIFSDKIGMLGGIVWAFTPAIHKLTVESGLETGISALLIIFLISRISALDYKDRNNKNLFIIALIASLTFLARLDNIFLVLFLGIWVVFKNKKLRNFLVLDGIIFFFSAYLSIMLRLGYVIDLYTYANGIYVFICLTLVVKIPVNFFFSLYQPERLPSTKKLIINSALSGILSLILIGLIFLPLISLVSWISFPRSTLIMDLIISFILLFFSRFFWNLINKKGFIGDQSPKILLLNQWNTWLKNLIIYYGTVGATVITYILYNSFVFHTHSPVSGQIKQWWGKMLTVYGTNVESIPEALGLSIKPWSFLVNPITYIQNLISTPLIKSSVFILIILCLLIIIFKNLNIFPGYLDTLIILPILAGSLWQIWTYNLRSYIGFRDWYWIAEYILIFLFFILITQFLFISLSNQKVRRLLISCCLIIFSLWIGSSYINRITGLTSYAQNNQQEGDYLFGVAFLEENTEPGSIIGMTGGGTTAYFIHDRTIVNLDGLINSIDYFQALKNHQVTDFLKSIDLHYVFAVPYIIMESSPYQEEFPNQLFEIGDYNKYTLYRFGNPDQ